MGHFFHKPNSDFCLSLTFGHNGNIYAKIFISTGSGLNLCLHLMGLIFLVRIFVELKRAEKQVQKKKDKTWVVKLGLFNFTNFLCDLVIDIISVGVVFGWFSVGEEILLGIALIPMIFCIIFICSVCQKCQNTTKET